MSRTLNTRALVFTVMAINIKSLLGISKGKVGGYWEGCHSEVDLWSQREKIKTVQVSISLEPT